MKGLLKVVSIIFRLQSQKKIKHLWQFLQACVTIIYSFVNLVETLNFISHGTALSIRLADSSPATGRRNASRSRLNYI